MRRLRLGNVLALFGFLAVALVALTAPSAQAQPHALLTVCGLPIGTPSATYPPVPPLTPSISVNNPTPRAGATVIITGFGYGIHETVRVCLFSDPVILGEAATDGNGAFTLSATIPGDTPTGTHDITGTGHTSQANATTQVTILGATGPGGGGNNNGGGGLAATGAQVLALLLLALVLIAVGVAVTMLSRRRTTASSRS